MLYYTILPRRREEKERAIFLCPVLTESEKKATRGKPEEREDKEKLPLCAAPGVVRNQ